MSSTQDYTCVFCNEMFEEKESLQEHFRKHGDPKFNYATKNKARFENEQSAGSDKSEEIEMVGCDVCEETFTTISKAITHKHKVHPDHDAKHFCPWCGKLFTMKHLYNKHMQSSHSNMSEIEQNNYHCDACNVDFFVPSAMIYHNKFFHRQDSELPSIGHSKKVKTFNQEMIQIYYCPFCGEEYNNKVNLHKHITDDHNDENQSPDEVLRCPLCDAVFYHLDAYELHLSFHSTEDIYSDDSEMAMSITEFSLESVPPMMEKVEEENKNAINEGIDKYLQLIMDESRESGINDGLDRPRSKKHKKHKKSKKAAITLDEFLNMNKDVFGDGLDVQGIEEVPTQQVLKKYKGRKDNIPKAIPATAIAKLKKQGITVKSNSGPNSPTFKTNRDVIIKKVNNNPNRISVLSAKPKPIVTSNELLSKLLNQGNNQIKIVKKTYSEQLSKDELFDPANTQEPPATSNIKQSVPDDSLIPRGIDTEEAHVNDIHEKTQKVSDIEVDNKLNDGGVVNNSESTNDTHLKNNPNLLSQAIINPGVKNVKSLNYDDNVRDIENSLKSSSHPASPEVFQKDEHEIDLQVSDNNDSFKTNEENMETIEQTNKNASADEISPISTQDKYTKYPNEGFSQVNCNILQRSTSDKSLDALKHLRGLITIKPSHNAEDKVDVMETNNLTETNEHVNNNKKLKVARDLGKNVQNVSFKKPMLLKKTLSSPNKSIDTLKTLNKQLTITPCVTSTTKCNDESDDDESDNLNVNDNINASEKNISYEKDDSNFKTPIAITKQHNTTAKCNNYALNAKTAPLQMRNSSKACIMDEENVKNTFNMDILKRLTNVTAKPIIKNANSPKITSNQSADSRLSVIQRVEKNKQIDQDIEIFNVDDSDSDQEFPREEFEPKLIINTPTSSDTKTTTSSDAIKNLSKNITIKPSNTHNKNSLSIKKEVSEDSSRQTSDGDLQTSNSSESKNISQNNKHTNIKLNYTLKRLGNNISIKSQYSSPDSQSHQMLHHEDIDDNFDMNNEESDSEYTDQVKITEAQEGDEDLPNEDGMEPNENVIVQSPRVSDSDHEEETYNSHSDEDIERQIIINTQAKHNSTSKCLDNFKRKNKDLTVKSLNTKSTALPQTGVPLKRQEEASQSTNKHSKDISIKQFRTTEKIEEDNEVLNRNVNHSAATSSSSQKVTNQVNTVKTVKTFQSETIIEEITTTVTKTIRTVNQSSKQVAKNANVTTSRPRMLVSNQQAKPLQGIAVRNVPTVGTKIKNAVSSPKATTTMPTKAMSQIFPVRPQNQMAPRQQGMFMPSAPGPSNIRKLSPQSNIQKPVIGRPLKISPLAKNPTVKRAPENITGHFNSLKKSKDSLIPAMDAFDDDNEDPVINYSSASNNRSDFSSTATKIIKGKSIVTATQARSEQHSEQHITKLNNMAGLKVVRTNTKQASQIETKNNTCASKRTTTMDAIEKLQKQGLLVKKPRVEEPEESEHFHSDSEEFEEND